MSGKKSYKTVTAPQKYLTITQMHQNFGSRGLVAYSCKIVEGVLEGGVVIAVMNEGDIDSREIKAYQRELRKKHPDKDPICFLRVEKDEEYDRLLLTYDNGGGERKIKPKLEVKKSDAEKAVAAIPAGVLALALKQVD
ncbi:MAG: hypothetical protein FWF78_09195 [Defluviitaleaceae bacterium]|nr:hypothetical protein [Defluviitaleaceae bacterium]